VAYFISTVGFATTSMAILLSLLPPPDEPNQALAVAKIIGLTGALLGIGVIIYALGRRRARSESSVAGVSAPPLPDQS
jgi:hypothetical protein